MPDSATAIPTAVTPPTIDTGDVLVVPRLPPFAPVRYLSRDSTMWIVAAAVTIFIGLFKAINLLLLLGYFLIVLWLVPFLVIQRQLQSWRGSRIDPGPIFANSPVTWRIELSHDSWVPINGLTVRDEVYGEGFGWLILRITGTDHRILRQERVFPTRGRHACGPLRLVTRFPFGLQQQAIVLLPEESIVILPELGRLQGDRFKAWLSRVQRGDGQVRSPFRHLSTHEAEVHGLRVFRPGDSPRWIHWRTSARRNELMVREFEEIAPPRLTLVIDPVAAGEPGDLEFILSLAATIIMDWTRELEAGLVLVALTAEKPVVLEAHQLSQVREMLQAVAEVEVYRGPPGEWATHVPRLVQTGSVLVLTTRDAERAREMVRQSLGRSVVALDASASVSWYEPPRADVPDASAANGAVADGRKG